jgi:hypothetical protein
MHGIHRVSWHHRRQAVRQAGAIVLSHRSLRHQPSLLCSSGWLTGEGFVDSLPTSAELLATGVERRHPLYVYVVTEADAAAIRAAYERDGELSAAVELRRRFPGITDNAIARNHARWIAGWASTPEQPVVRLPKGKVVP